jgi:tRNA (guanine37-N1)-methyltransferase
MIIVDATSRLIPGVLGGEESTLEESHSNNLLEYPHYTRPSEFRGWPIPDILLSGHHANIARWRRKESIRRTRARRPDLFAKLDLSSKQDQKTLRELDDEEKA